MKTNDLMLGNYVNTPNGILQINRIYPDGAAFTERYMGYFHDTLEPIPITHELLLQCGFENDNFLGDYIMPNSGFIAHFDKELRFYIANDLQLDHVKELHQLQNIFKLLTDKELNVNF